MSEPAVQLPQDLAQQLARYEAYAEVDSSNGLIWLQLGDLYHRAGRLDEATACFERCAVLSPDNRVPQARIASVCISAHRFDLAESKLKSLLEAGDEDASLLHNLGLAVFYQERWAEAGDYFRAAQARGLSAAGNYAYLSRTLHYEGEMDDAIAACREWVALEPNAESMGYLALLEMDHDHPEEALRLAREALALEPDQVDAGIVVGNAAVEQQEMIDAKPRFLNAIRKQPNNGRAWLGLGLTHLYEQQYRESINALDRAARLMPENSGTIVALAWAHLCNKDARTAEGIFRQAIRADRNFAEAHGGLAAALAFQNKVDQAKETARTSMRLNPQNLGAGLANSVLLKRAGRDELAQELMTKILQSRPTPDAKPLIDHLLLYGNKHAAKAPNEPKT